MASKSRRDAIRAANTKALVSDVKEKKPEKTTIVDDFINSALEEEESNRTLLDNESINDNVNEIPSPVPDPSMVTSDPHPEDKPLFDLNNPEINNLVKEQIKLMVKNGEIKIPNGGRPAIYGERTLISVRMPKTLLEFAKENGRQYGGVTPYIIHLIEEDKKKTEENA